MNNPKVGFVSLGCPKALVDSERILTQLRTDGYEIAPSYDGADVVVVNTCGFIDSARAESLHAIGEALNENGRVIVTGCMGVDEKEIREFHPSVLSVSGPQQYEQVVGAVKRIVLRDLDCEKSIWQTRFLDNRIRNEEDFMTHVEYIRFNPEKHGVVDDRDQYEWCFIHARPFG